jgi:putative copper resistance protein D
MGVAAVVVVAVPVAVGTWPYAVLGTSDPGPVVRIGAPLLRLIVDLSATVCVGGLVFAAFFTRPGAGGGISPAGYAALRSSGRSAVVWLVAVAVLWPLDAAATAGLPLSRVLGVSAMSTLTGALEGPKAWLVTMFAVAVVAAGCRWTLRWSSTLVLVGMAIFAVMPALAAGHSASDTGHDLATAAILIHVPVAVVWLGTLIAVVRVRGVGDDRPAVLRRYRRLSTICWWVVAYSGLVDAAVLAPGGSPLTTGYGLILIAKAMILAGVGWLVLRVKRAGRARGSGAFLVLELAALVVVFGASVVLTDLPAPKFIGHLVSGDQTLLGYNLTAPPTVVGLLVDWRVEVLFAPLCVVLAGVYLCGVRRLRRTGVSWSATRTTAWLAGCLVLLLATSSGLGRYAPAMFSVQAAVHMLVGMVAPILLALGAPLSLAAAALRPATGDQLPGVREWLVAARDSALLRTVTHPLVAASVFIGGPFVLYFTPALDLTVRFHWAHLAMDLLFLVIGYLFAWLVIGPDPLPRPIPALMRLGLLLAVMPADIVFAAAVLSSHRLLGDGVAGANLYTALDLPWVASLAADQRLGAYLLLGIGEACVLLVLVVLVARWRYGDDDDDSGYAAVAAALRRRAVDAAAVTDGDLSDRAEGAQPQTVGDHQQRGQRHRGAGDQWVEQSGGGDR